MSVRKIMVANTENQSRKVIESEAETLGQLKRDFDANGIQYQDLDITEGLSKTALLNDDSLLPSPKPFKGYDLVMLITRTRKKTASGIDAMSRKEAYDIIKSHPEVAEYIKKTTGKNYTVAKTADLIEAIGKAKVSAFVKEPEVEVEEPETTAETTTEEGGYTPLVDSVLTLVEALADSDKISATELRALAEAINNMAPDYEKHCQNCGLNTCCSSGDKEEIKEDEDEEDENDITSEDLDDMLDSLI